MNRAIRSAGFDNNGDIPVFRDFTIGLGMAGEDRLACLAFNRAVSPSNRKNDIGIRFISPDRDVALTAIFHSPELNWMKTSAVLDAVTTATCVCSCAFEKEQLPPGRMTEHSTAAPVGKVTVTPLTPVFTATGTVPELKIFRLGVCPLLTRILAELVVAAILAVGELTFASDIMQSPFPLAVVFFPDT